jgi:hypothetical protein
MYLHLKWKFKYCAKGSDPIKKPDPEMEGEEHLQMKQLKNIGAKLGLFIFTNGDPKILKYLA